MASEQDCVDLCNVYANIASLECTFAAWEKKTLMGTCHLYNEPFSTYLSHCDVISGPPDVSGCLVEHPDENSCHGVRDGECVMQGRVFETFESIGGWQDCANICKGMPSRCKAWSYRDEPIRTCDLYDSADKQCSFSYTPSGVNLDECGFDPTTATKTTIATTTTTTTSTTTTAATTTTTSTANTAGFVIVGGKGGSRLRTVELLTEQLEEVDCSIPDLPFGRYFHTVSLFDAETLVVCGGRNTDLDCISWSREDSTWRPFATLSPPRKEHTAYTKSDGKMFLIGGEGSEAIKTGVELPGGRTFNLEHESWYGCLVSTSDLFVTLGGKTAAYPEQRKVARYSSLGDFEMELPELNRGRVSPACTSFFQQNGDLGLLVAGGVEGFTGQYLDSVELLLPGASEWTAGPKLPAAMKEGMAVNLNSHVLLTGGYQDFVGPVDEIFEFNFDNQSWDLVGQMSEAKSAHSITTLNFAQFCE